MSHGDVDGRADIHGSGETSEFDQDLKGIRLGKDARRPVTLTMQEAPVDRGLEWCHAERRGAFLACGRVHVVCCFWDKWRVGENENFMNNTFSFRDPCIKNKIFPPRET